MDILGCVNAYLYFHWTPVVFLWCQTEELLDINLTSLRSDCLMSFDASNWANGCATVSFSLQIYGHFMLFWKSPTVNCAEYRSRTRLALFFILSLHFIREVKHHLKVLDAPGSLFHWGRGGGQFLPRDVSGLPRTGSDSPAPAVDLRLVLVPMQRIWEEMRAAVYHLLAGCLCLLRTAAEVSRAEVCSGS